jgi:hypothetical protein
MLIRTEQTPNPATRKFLPGQTVMDAGTRDFADAGGADVSPLAKALFDSGLSRGLLAAISFRSRRLRITPVDLEPLVVETLLDHFVSGAPLFVARQRCCRCMWRPMPADEDPADAEIIDQIRELIETASGRPSRRMAATSLTGAICDGRGLLHGASTIDPIHALRHE